jgi:hypothetical protein
MGLAEEFSLQKSVESPANGAFLITPADSDMTKTARFLYLSAVATLKLTMLNDDVITTPQLGVGYHPLSVKRVWSTGSTFTPSTIMGLV